MALVLLVLAVVILIPVCLAFRIMPRRTQKRPQASECSRSREGCRIARMTISPASSSSWQ
ncbi:hypothetical protein XH99_18390 [Bradyrhizobium nanningense]|uniref:Uncharacterized protein n=1 Tax=Bradyrhizobium nanningense TaxID=1325118 RepID=A0A4Q0S3U2_9BRAD|nr:hypothetical protein XH99_18390 [Bradyrhizobium nanningense]RXH27900.1 hypothetical protein XH84_26875 [Bradyrhizobium nanningense]TQF31820.1 hypothetical protein UNPA324_20960 [Bradyrhizobium sp. UNPA324]